MGKNLLAEIQVARQRGELLGPLCEKYGAEAVVKALGVKHVAVALGVQDDEDAREVLDDLLEWGQE
jgi:hypothetical protein